MTTTTGVKVRLSPGNWIALASMVLVMLMSTLASYVQITSRLERIETRQLIEIRDVQRRLDRLEGPAWHHGS